MALNEPVGRVDARRFDKFAGLGTGDGLEELVLQGQAEIRKKPLRIHVLIRQLSSSA
jgi:hypothetical protein